MGCGEVDPAVGFVVVLPAVPVDFLGIVSLVLEE